VVPGEVPALVGIFLMFAELDTLVLDGRLAGVGNYGPGKNGPIGKMVQEKKVQPISPQINSSVAY